MLNVTKEFSWAMNHRLENHKGLCKNLHGHNYRLFITVIREDGLIGDDNKSGEGMVIDFKSLKNIVNKVIVDDLDHAFAYNKNSNVDEQIAKALEEKIQQKIFAFDFRTTAENMVKWMVESLNNYLTNADTGVRCTKAVLYETDTCYATYEEGK